MKTAYVSLTFLATLEVEDGDAENLEELLKEELENNICTCYGLFGLNDIEVDIVEE